MSNPKREKVEEKLKEIKKKNSKKKVPLSQNKSKHNTPTSKGIFTGKPRQYNSVEEVETIIEDYFRECQGEVYISPNTGEPVVDKYGNPLMIGARPPTVTGLALALNLTRDGLLDYQGRAEYTDAIARAKQRCQEYAESRLYSRDGARGAEFSLACNFNWGKDKSQQRNGDQNEEDGAGIILIPSVDTPDTPDGNKDGAGNG